MRWKASRTTMLGKPPQSHTAACRERIETQLKGTDDGQARLQRADERVTEAIVRESERLMRESSRDNAESASRVAEPPSVVRESTAESAPSADDGSRPPPPPRQQQASMGRGGGNAETRRSQRGRKRVVSGDMSEADQREAISRRLPDDDPVRGQKRSSDGEGDVQDQRESISRRLPDDNAPAPAGTPQSYGPDIAGAVEKRKVRWDTDVETFEAQSTWGGARRDMAVVIQKLGCDHDVSEFYSPPRVVKMARELGMKGGVSLDLTVPASDGYVWGGTSAGSIAEIVRHRLLTRSDHCS